MNIEFRQAKSVLLQRKDAMSPSKLSWSIVGLMMLGLVAACVPMPTALPAAPPTTVESTAVQPKSGGVLKVGIQADVQSLDPHMQDSYSSLLVIEQVYEALLRFAPDMAIEPALAESYEIKDPLTYEFKLRKGVDFHNGREVKAEDVKYSLERVRNPDGGSPRSYWLANVSSIDTPDDHTVVLHLSKPYAPLLSYLANASMAIVPKEVVEQNGDLSKVMVGTGPFVFAENTPGTRTTLKKNDDYWMPGRPYLDGIEFIPMPDDRSRTDNIVTGNVDFADQIPQKDIDILSGKEGLVLEGGPSTLHDFLFFNERRPPFDSVKVRQAIAWALDRQAMTDAVLFGHGRAITCGPIPPWSWAFSDCVVYDKQDLERAKTLLAEAGYPQGFSMVIKTGAPYKAHTDAAQMIVEWLAPLGVEAEVAPTEWGTFIDEVLIRNDYDAGVVGWIGQVDPDDWLYGLYHTDEQWNVFAYSNPEVDRLLEAGQVTTDQQERKAIYDQAQKIIAEDAPVAFFHNYEQYEALRDYVKGYQNMPNASKITFVDTWMDR
jgi:peptide/nickel transport system substrate-binding protein